MVGVSVRDEDRVELAERAEDGCGAVPAERPEPIAEDGIGQEAYAIEFDEQRRVAQVRDPELVGRLFSRLPSSAPRALRASRLAPGPTWSAASGSV